MQEECWPIIHGVILLALIIVSYVRRQAALRIVWRGDSSGEALELTREDLREVGYDIYIE